MNEKKSSPEGLKTVDFQTNQSCLGSATDGTANTICCPHGRKAQVSLSSLEQPIVQGTIQTPVGAVPQISSSLDWTDRWGSIKARWGVGRMRYTVEPGLYALGRPDNQAPVLVTANYKMSFDRLREALPDRDAWILVLWTPEVSMSGVRRQRGLLGRRSWSGALSYAGWRKWCLTRS